MVISQQKTLNLKTYLKKLTQEELIQEISGLVNRFPVVKEYYQSRLNPDSEMEILANYKKLVKKEFFPDRGFGEARIAIAKKPVSEFRKVSVHIENLIDLMLYYVEQGVKYTLEYGDIDEPFYNSMESMYENTLKLIKEHGLFDQFYARCKKMVADTRDMGWGFHDGLKASFEHYYKNYQ